MLEYLEFSTDPNFDECCNLVSDRALAALESTRDTEWESSNFGRYSSQTFLIDSIRGAWDKLAPKYHSRLKDDVEPYYHSPPLVEPHQAQSQLRAAIEDLIANPKRISP